MESKTHYVQFEVLSSEPAPIERTLTLAVTPEQFDKLHALPEGTALRLGGFAIADGDGRPCVE